jgi:hypothetical protein
VHGRRASQDTDAGARRRSTMERLGAIIATAATLAILAALALSTTAMGKSMLFGPAELVQPAGGTSCTTSGTTSGHASNKNSGKNSNKNSGKNSNKNSDKNSGTGCGHQPKG